MDVCWLLGSLSPSYGEKDIRILGRDYDFGYQIDPQAGSSLCSRNIFRSDE